MYFQSQVIWITGLSAAGKTTLASEVFNELKKCGVAAIMLDGDELRQIFGFSSSNAVDHSRASRLDLAMKYSLLCKMIANQGITVVIATISLFSEVHAWNRLNLPGYFEVYLKVPLAELRRRDPKGIYKGYDSGAIKYVAGIDLDIDEPADPDLVVIFDPKITIQNLAAKVIEKLEEKKNEN